MPRNSLEGKADDVLAGEGGGSDRYVTMRLDLVRELVHQVGGQVTFSQGETLFTAGGVWDTLTKRYVRRGTKARVTALHPGQMPAATWAIRWIEARERGELLRENGKPVFSCQFHGGRRAGKSDLAGWLQLAYLLAFPGAKGSYVVENYSECTEILAFLELALMPQWAKKKDEVGDPEFGWYFINGSFLTIRTANPPKKLKKGGEDWINMHEAQKLPVKAYTMVRPQIADRGGMICLLTNPQDEEDGDEGEWVQTYFEKANAGRLGGRAFVFDWRKNPHVVQEALEGMTDELDEETIARERDGLFRPKRLAIIYGFSNDLNVKAPPPPEFNVTRAFTKRLLDAPFDRVHGLDFQSVPHMAAATAQVFRDPEDPDGEPLLWYVDCLLVENATEEEFVTELEGKGYTGTDAIVPDASGEWQDGKHNPGKHSLDVFRARGWRKIFLPDPMTKANPPVSERFAVANWLFGGGDGKRRAYVAPWCLELIQALRRFRRNKKTGAINRHDPNAHLVDAATYLSYRLFPRRAPRGRSEYHSVQPAVSQRRRDLEVY